jgi:choline-sulfatase
LSALALPAYGHRVVKTPHIDALARESVLFEQAYCNFPFCAPSRIAMLSGQLPSRVGAYDNGAEVSASVPTVMHYLRARGYHTSLSGKMHFIGPDQLHGYEERLTTDIYPADFSTTPDWSIKGMPVSGISFRGVVEAGVCKRNLQIDFDEDVHHAGLRKLYALGRARQQGPFMLTVSYTHPHNPFNTTQAYWDRYDHDAIDLPVVPHIPYEQRDPHSRRHYLLTRMDEYDMTDERIRMARHAYYGMVSYFDDKVGELLGALDDAGLADNTVVVLTADHGEMLGERGMWLKDNFLEDSVRVPLMIAGPGILPRRSAEVVSLVDLMPTLLDLAKTDIAVVDPLDGRSLLPLLAGDVPDWDGVAIIDFAGGGHDRVARAVRKGRYKCIVADGLPPQLFDVAADPNELTDLAGNPSHGEALAELTALIADSWNPAELNAQVQLSQKRRLLIQQATDKSGNYPNWAAVVRNGDADRFVRGRASSFYAKAKFRFPPIEPIEVPERD